METEVLAAIAALAGVLTVGAVTGVLHGGKANQVGDRVACGVLALPLISLLAEHAVSKFPVAPWLAPAPLVLYLVLLALTEPPNTEPRHQTGLRKFVEIHFTWVLLGLAALLYFAAFLFRHAA